MAKSWREKLDAPNQKAHVSVIDKPFGGMPAGSRMFIAHPLQIKSFLDSIPAGTSCTVPEMRATLAQEAGADGTCPLTAGIFVRIAAEVALEELQAGKAIEEVTPFWRILDKKSPMLKKLSCGPDFVLQQRAAEGLK